MRRDGVASATSHVRIEVIIVLRYIMVQYHLQTISARINNYGRRWGHRLGVDQTCKAGKSGGGLFCSCLHQPASVANHKGLFQLTTKKTGQSVVGSLMRIDNSNFVRIREGGLPLFSHVAKSC